MPAAQIEVGFRRGGLSDVISPSIIEPPADLWKTSGLKGKTPPESKPIVECFDSVWTKIVVSLVAVVPLVEPDSLALDPPTVLFDTPPRFHDWSKRIESALPLSGPFLKLVKNSRLQDPQGMSGFGTRNYIAEIGADGLESIGIPNKSSDKG